MTARKVAFRYYGGKSSHLAWMLPLMPAMPLETRYVEPFCGSCAIAINRKHNKGARVFLNDSNFEIVNFFRVLRDNPEALTYRLEYTPNSQHEHRMAQEMKISPSDEPNIDAAWALAVKINQSFGGIIRSGKETWASYVEFGEGRAATFKDIARVIRKFHFHNEDAMDVIERHNKKQSFIYLDPPYTMDSRDGYGYAHELAGDDEMSYHQRLLSLAVDSPAFIAISGYHSELYDDMLSGWHCHEQAVHAGIRAVEVGDKKPPRTECLWTNYSPQDGGGRQSRLV